MEVHWRCLGYLLQYLRTTRQRMEFGSRRCWCLMRGSRRSNKNTKCGFSQKYAEFADNTQKNLFARINDSDDADLVLQNFSVEVHKVAELDSTKLEIG